MGQGFVAVGELHIHLAKDTGSNPSLKSVGSYRATDCAGNLS